MWIVITVRAIALEGISSHGLRLMGARKGRAGSRASVWWRKNGRGCQRQRGARSSAAVHLRTLTSVDAQCEQEPWASTHLPAVDNARARHESREEHRTQRCRTAAVKRVERHRQ